MKSSLVQLSPWKNYKRRVDNVPVSARLVNLDGTKLLEVKESRGSEFRCPDCKYLLTQREAEEVPNFFLEPPVFHEFHRPLD